MTSRAVALRHTVDRYAPVLLAVVVAAAVWGSATGALGARSPLPRALVLAVAVLAGWAAATVRARCWPLFVAAAAAWLLLAAWPAAVVASGQAGLRLRDRRRLLAFLAGAALVSAVGVLIGVAVGGERRLTTATPANATAMFALTVLFPLVVGLWIRARRDTLSVLRDRAERLEREQEARAERVRAEERARIAREMHDVVAHRVSLMVVHAGALEVTAADPATVEAATLIRSTGRQALTDLREVLGVLRQPGPAGRPATVADGLAGVDDLVRESRAAGLRVDRRDEGTPRPVPATVGRTVYRVVQEALTNVRKHAPDTDTTVRLRHLSGGVEVSVRNTPSGGVPGADAGAPPEGAEPGPGARGRVADRAAVRGAAGGSADDAGLSGARGRVVDRAAVRGAAGRPAGGAAVRGSGGGSAGGVGLPGAGLGLIGLRERVELLGGRLEAGPCDGGFLVRALIPVEEAT
ncbi:Signal transduction histidine kinase [Micromonospora citrea]|uniref:histidine kinase n=1 Tax=Micromonospora citrea TaxID=47855 RepID=A0A1C6UZD6_9ACTN|nr:sensor histidine kinase [Micromonospora citrea]SCL59180.1 Signal transduction histidine kinase [Micromonospora citrea]